MGWRTLFVGAVSLMALTGCPQEFGKHGRIDKAIHKDLMEQMQKNCSRADLEKYCKEGMPEEDCLEQCG